MESASRVVFGVLLAVGVLNGPNAAAVAIAAAPLLSLIVVPWALGRPGAAHVGGAGGAPTAAEPEFTLAHGLGFAGAVLVIMVSEQAILNSGVLIVKVDTGSDALAALIFAVLMIARAPLQLFQAVSTTLLPHLTRLMVTEQGRRPRRRLRPQRAAHGRRLPRRSARVDRDRRAGRRAGRDAAPVRARSSTTTAAASRWWRPAWASTWPRRP